MITSQATADVFLYFNFRIGDERFPAIFLVRRPALKTQLQHFPGGRLSLPSKQRQQAVWPQKFEEKSEKKLFIGICGQMGGHFERNGKKPVYYSSRFHGEILGTQNWSTQHRISQDSVHRFRRRRENKIHWSSIRPSCLPTNPSTPQLLPSLKLTASLPLKMDGWNSTFLLGFGLFWGQTVGFRVNKDIGCRGNPFGQPAWCRWRPHKSPREVARRTTKTWPFRSSTDRWALAPNVWICKLHPLQWEKQDGK